jgi:hypothetical protein
MKGSGLKVNEMKEFLQSSYQVNAPKNLLGYVLDEDFSNLYGKVYVNEDMTKALLSFCGTGMENLGSDWLNNLVYFANSTTYKLTPRLKYRFTYL